MWEVFRFCFFIMVLHKAREAAKSGLVLFHEAMEKVSSGNYEEGFAHFERAAAKQHEESIWIGKVVKDVELGWDTLKEAFAKTEEPLGWHFAGMVSKGRERFDFYKKSADGGCSWGGVRHGGFFGRGLFVEKDKKVYVEWLEKALNQNNPLATEWLGDWFEDEGGDKQKAVSYYRVASELGWAYSMHYLARMLKRGEGCEKDLRQAVIWGAKGDSFVFWSQLRDAERALESGVTEKLDCDFNQLCYSIGWGLYWYQYPSEHWNEQDDEAQSFGNRCLAYYYSCVELQQKSIFTLLCCWNQTTGVKGPGQMIGKMVWEGREDNLVEVFEGEKRL
jgi:TPR repeat protein